MILLRTTATTKKSTSLDQFFNAPISLPPYMCDVNPLELLWDKLLKNLIRTMFQGK
jgi:transposase